MKKLAHSCGVKVGNKWPAAGSVDTEIRCFTEPEVEHGAASCVDAPGFARRFFQRFFASGHFNRSCVRPLIVAFRHGAGMQFEG